MIFPVITMGRYHTQDGNIYIQRDDGIWRQNVNYLAAVPTQYNCNTFEEHLERIARLIENGKLRSSYTSGQPFSMQGGRLYQIK